MQFLNCCNEGTVFDLDHLFHVLRKTIIYKKYSKICYLMVYTHKTNLKKVILRMQ